MSESITASLRRQQLRQEQRPESVPDTKPRLPDEAKIIIKSDDIPPTLFFGDDKGYTTPEGESYIAEDGDPTFSESDIVYPPDFPENIISQDSAIMTDYIAGLIEAPQNKTYIVTHSLPFPVTITNFASAFGAGSGTVDLDQSGAVSAGSQLSVTVSGLSSAEDLRFQINFTRVVSGS